MNRNEAVTTWRDVCGNDTVMASGIVTGRMLEDFAARIEAAERERCAVAAWNHYMDTCKKTCRSPALWHEWCASNAVREHNPKVGG
jgi:hypothetical protein